MSTDLAEGFYWVRWVSVEEDPAPFVAERHGGTWFLPGVNETVKGTKLEVVSARITPPAVARARARVSTGR